jgi:hypothetical protein
MHTGGKTNVHMIFIEGISWLVPFLRGNEGRGCLCKNGSVNESPSATFEKPLNE